MEERKKFRIFILSITVFLIGVLIIGILGMLGFFHKNPYGQGTKIDNFRSFYRDVPTNTYDSVTASLYDIISKNLDNNQSIPTDGAEIRADTVSDLYNENTLMTSSSFIVDIASIQQSYRIQMVWSSEPKAENNISYSVVASCVAEYELIYPEFTCTDMRSEDPLNTLFSNNPIIYKLPITVSYYEDNFSRYVNYTISYTVIDDYSNIKLIITDYTGGNYTNAIEKIQILGYNPSDYQIEYIEDLIEYSS